ncbi:hypothetical protein Unana1_05029 [Umbelopsis nana]
MMFKMAQFASHREFYLGTKCASGQGTSCMSSTVPDGFLTSRLIPRSNFSPGESLAKYTQVFTNVSKTLMQELGGVMAGNLVAGGQVAKIDPESVGVNPAWRTALVHLIIPIAWPENSTLVDKQWKKKRLQELTQRLIDMTPDSGAYLNEASPEEPNWKYSFFGDHYEKLLAIKLKWDPKHLFVCRECVGSDATY